MSPVNLFTTEFLFSMILERLPIVGSYIVYRNVDGALIGYFFDGSFLFHNRNYSKTKLCGPFGCI